MVSEVRALARMTSMSCQFVSSSFSVRQRTAALWEAESTNKHKRQVLYSPSINGFTNKCSRGFSLI